VNFSPSALIAPRNVFPTRSGTVAKLVSPSSDAKNGAAHEGRAANAGQDRAGEPLDRNSAAVDHAAGAAIDRERRLVAEIGRLGVRARSVRAAQITLIQSSSPALAIPG
jgi:hypothetical protein